MHILAKEICLINKCAINFHFNSEILDDPVFIVNRDYIKLQLLIQYSVVPDNLNRLPLPLCFYELEIFRLYPSVNTTLILN